tara:strand:+ start:1098 stop:1532 length:435 start_codon:yes stop_codon:yes gene_type:complete
MRLNVLTTLLILSSLTLCAQNNLGRAGQQLNSLRGKISGVSITNTAHTSGAASSINVRGMSSLMLSNQPLIIVDGVEFNSSVSNMSGDYWDGISSTSRLIDIDPNTIHKIEVLKGLSQTMIYGEKGRNGVILITTKNGKNSDPE